MSAVIPYIQITDDRIRCMRIQFYLQFDLRFDSPFGFVPAHIYL